MLSIFCSDPVSFCFVNFFLPIVEEWESHTKIAKAFKIGSKEALAVSHLQERVAPQVVQRLLNDVRPRGMKNWLSHDVVAKGLFNEGFSSASGTAEAWQEACTNGSDLELVA